MNTKPLFFLCFLCALFLISAVATEPSNDETQVGAAEESKIDPGLNGWGGHGHGGGWSGGGHGHGGGGSGGGHGHGGGGSGGGHGAEESKIDPGLNGWGGHGHGGGWSGGGGHGGGCRKCCGRWGCKCC